MSTVRRPLTGVAYLRCEHVRSHRSLQSMIAGLVAAGQQHRFTPDDVAAFVCEGCGVCETAKMRRCRFTIQTVADKTQSPVGKRWVSDVLELRTPSPHFGYIAINLFVDTTSKLRFAVGLLGQTTEDLHIARYTGVGLTRWRSSSL